MYSQSAIILLVSKFISSKVSKTQHVFSDVPPQSQVEIPNIQKVGARIFQNVQGLRSSDLQK